MNNAANSTIKGFYYQFNKTLGELIDAPKGTTIIPEGLIEDIDVISGGSYRAIQCKYLESKSGYKDSILYQPILEMVLSYHYYQNQGYNKAEYVLYVYYDKCKQSDINITVDYINKMMLSKDADLITKYICRLLVITDPKISTIVEKQKRSKKEKEKLIAYVKDNAAKLQYKVLIKDFLRRLTVEIGLSSDELFASNMKKMIAKNMEKEEIEKFFYPNAISAIAEKSQFGDPENRKIESDVFWQNIQKDKKILVTRWTTQLVGKTQLLKHKRNQLSSNVQIPTRKRFFIIEVAYSSGVEIPESDLCNFLVNYLQIFKRKPTQTSIPMFFIDCADPDYMNRLEKILFQRNIMVNNGQIGGEIQELKLFSLENYNNNIKMALCKMSSEIKNIIAKYPPDDLFIIGDRKTVFETPILCNIEYLYVDALQELEYLLQMQKEI